MSQSIIEEKTIADLENLSRRFQAQADQAQRTANEMQSAAKLIQENLKRARELNRPVHIPIESVRNGGEKATSNSKGANKIVAYLSIRDIPADVDAIASGCALSASTVRTYVPILERAQLITWESTGYTLTTAGMGTLV